MPGQYYALWGERSGTYLTSGGKVIIHDNRKEMEFLFPRTRVVPLQISPDPETTIALFAVPGMEAVQFPLKKEDFR
jgi:hypothetical protein